MRPLIYNCKKADDKIARLEGEIIHLNLELEARRKRDTAEPVEREDGADKWYCPRCMWPVAMCEDSMKLMREKKLGNYCPVCGQRLKW